MLFEKFDVEFTPSIPVPLSLNNLINSFVVVADTLLVLIWNKVLEPKPLSVPFEKNTVCVLEGLRTSLNQKATEYAVVLYPTRCVLLTYEDVPSKRKQEVASGLVGNRID